ncbi:MAG: histidine phosphatase family protein, partial [Acidimicrobiia bacterium]
MIVFARHGQTAPNRDGLVLGRADPELTEEGHREAALLAAVLAEEPVTAILT